MTEDYIFKYTNGYANYGKIDSDELKIEGDCKITNYDPRVDDGKSKGEITIDFSGGEQSVKDGTGTGYKSVNKANFSKKKFSIFKDIAALDGNSNELSLDDIKKMGKSLAKRWGLKDLKIDFNNGVATLVWGENDILRIDFATKNEKNTTAAVKNNPEKVDSVKYVKPKSLEEASANIYNIIPKEYAVYIKLVAKNAGVSEDLVKTFIINEGMSGTKEAALTAYKRKDDVWTIGFGHTNLCREMDFKVKEGVTISLQQAFKLLEGDIKEMKRYARSSVGAKNFDKSPESIQALFIEYCFQNGPGGKLKNDNIKYNLADNLYEAIAAGSLFEGNYNRRSAYRFILAIGDFSIEEKQNALKRLKTKGNYNKILNCLSGTEKAMFKDFCEQIEKSR